MTHEIALNDDELGIVLDALRDRKAMVDAIRPQPWNDVFAVGELYQRFGKLPLAEVTVGPSLLGRVLQSQAEAAARRRSRRDLRNAAFRRYVNSRRTA